MGGIEFTLIIVALLNLVLGSIIYLRGRQNKATTWYAFAVLAVTWWSISSLLFRTVDDPMFARFWVVSSYAAPAFVTFAFLSFAFYFPYGKSRVKKSHRILALVGCIGMEVIVLFPGFIPEVVLDTYPRRVAFGAWQMYLYLAYITGYVGWAFTHVVSAYRESPRELRKDAVAVAVGAAITAVLGVSGGIIAPVLGNFDYFWAGPASTAFLFVITGYAITRYQLLNIKVVAVEIMTILIELILIAEIFFSRSQSEFFLRVAIAFFVGIFSFYLTRGVNREVQLRQEMEDLTNELQRTNTELQKLDEAKSEFLSIASHQLRTPLTAIKGFISMIQEGSYGKPTEREQATLAKVYDSNERLVKLVNDLLDVSKIESGGFKYEWEPVEAGSLILGVINELERNVIQKGLYIRFEDIKDIPAITADSSKLRQVFINLIDNAVRYTQKGGITVRMKQDGDTVKIAIEDTGIGLEPDEIKELFKKYSRAKSALTVVEGTGIGLYVAKRIVEDHKGQIWVESPGHGKGSTFYINLPLQKNAAEAGEARDVSMKIPHLRASEIVQTVN